MTGERNAERKKESPSAAITITKRVVCRSTLTFLRSMKNAKLVVINALFMCSQYRTIRITQYSAVSILKGTHGNALYRYIKTFT